MASLPTVALHKLKFSTGDVRLQHFIPQVLFRFLRFTIFEKSRQLIVSGWYLIELIFHLEAVRIWTLRPAMMLDPVLTFDVLFIRITSIKGEVVAVICVGFKQLCETLWGKDIFYSFLVSAI